MSHSKMTRRGRSHYIESWNRDAKRFINTCIICGHKGYSPTVDEDGFCDDQIRAVIRSELKQTLQPLPLDELGRCPQCAAVQDRKQDRNKE